MNDTNVKMTQEVVEAIHRLQEQNTAADAVDVLQRLMVFVLREEGNGDDRERLDLAREIIWLQDIMRAFILPQEGGAR